jgi:hypothetical protein
MKDRMPQRKITVTEVLGAIENPEYTFPGNQPGTLGYYGTTSDGRAFYAVVTGDRSFVITSSYEERYARTTLHLRRFRG